MRACQQSDVSLGRGSTRSVPDKKFLDVAMRINPQDKMCGKAKWKNTSCVNVLKRICLQACLAAKRAVLRWRRLQLDRHPKEVAAQQVSDQQLETARFRFRTTRRPQKKRICTGRSLKNFPASERR